MHTTQTKAAGLGTRAASRLHSITCYFTPARITIAAMFLLNLMALALLLASWLIGGVR
jgi:hypothetical protein